MREQVELLKDHPDLRAELCKFPPLLRERLTVDQDFAGVDGLEPVDCAAECRFARSGRADDNDDLAFFYGKIYIFQDMKLSVMLVYMSELYDGSTRLSSLCHIFFSYLSVVIVVILKTFSGRKCSCIYFVFAVCILPAYIRSAAFVSSTNDFSG